MLKDLPIKYVYLETTNHCNLDCVFCNRREVVNSQNLRHMSMSKWKICLDILKNEPISEAKLMGLGEPFFHPNFDEVTMLFKEYFPNCFTISATNLQYKVSKKFFNASSYLNLLYLSIDGYEKTYEEARPGSKWTTLINSLNEIDTYYKLNSEMVKPRYEINFVATAQNVESLEAVYNLVDQYEFIDDMRINIAQWWGEEKEIDHTQIQKVKEYLIPYSHKVKGKSPWDFKDCWWPREGIYMTVDGSLKICCMNTSTKSVGNIFIDNLDQLRSSGPIADLRESLANNKQEIDHCKFCSYKTLEPILANVLAI
ncbi:Cyclic pyranopterin monophosphate synthase [Prochlorococcus marinus str. MIT 1318]|uniref:radical SAM/SPASM domain-containing protein n=1 Tax=Prochlorococcus TaxID=1218 RepID=UPI0007BB0E24|nr:radical SAM/SPASM domain-containing protein [Prochlorococcus marinus]KZR70738.1 Cyclic pyranopterin monophosphate synthase [Prochlorococcus marinus str. MIT 1318]